MRTLAIGDIHGCFTALRTLVDTIALRPDDRLITLGDYINRGHNSFAVVEWLLRRKDSGGLISLRGNHEEMLLRARGDRRSFEDWLSCGGKQTLASYSHLPDDGNLADIPDDHWRFFEETQLWCESESHFFVHANAYPDMPLDEQPEYTLLWEKFDAPPPHESGKTMVCGHTPQKSGRPLNVGHAVCIDTWVYGKGWLTCLDVESGRYWQANEQGEAREAFLDDP
jgi:serine/threonine protein phosphatase 1